MKINFEVGEIVKVIHYTKNYFGQEDLNHESIGKYFTVLNVNKSLDWPVRLSNDLLYKNEELIRINTMNIKEKFILTLTREPQKSFRKAGITNGDDMLTDDGVKVFMTWMLNKNAEAFKTEVVDGLLADMKDECK